MSLSRWIALAVVVALLGTFFYLDLGSYLTLDRIKAQQADLQALLEETGVAVVFGAAFGFAALLRGFAA